MSQLVLAKIENLLWEVKLIPTQIEVAYKSNKAMKDPDYIKNLQKKKEEKALKKLEREQKMQEKKAEREEAKSDKEVMKAAQEAAKEERGDEPFSESVSNHITTLGADNSLKTIQLIKKAGDTNKIIQFACYYMSNENAKLIKLSEKEREICNGIADIFNFGKIYESAGVANLKLYDADYEEYLPASNYILSIKDIESRKNDFVFIENMKKRKEQLANTDDLNEETEQNAHTIWQSDEDGIVHPVFIPEDGNVKPFEEAKKNSQGAGISDELFKSLENVFVPILGIDEHRYEMLDNGLVRLFITRPEYNVEEFYTVDPGLVMGAGKIYILANIGNDTLFVSTDHKDIVKNILSSAFYVLNATEVQEVLQDYFRNMNIYRYVDMSNTEFLKDLSEEDFQKLGKKLTFILSKIVLQNDGAVSETPRFRFNYWNGVDDFIIISDPTVKSPLKETNETSSIICEGLMFEVKGDDVTQRLKTNVIEYHIDKYRDI